MLLNLKNIYCQRQQQLLLKFSELNIEQGCFFALLGPNGAGKTTLLKCIAGDMPCSGEILLNGKPLKNYQPLERAKNLAVLPQNSQLTFPFTAEEVVTMGCSPLSLGRAEQGKLVKVKMQLCDCLHLKDRPFPTLSGGEQQRVQLAKVLVQLSQATQPPLLLLDEPTSAQDLGQQHSILKMAEELCSQNGYTVIAILHDLNHALRYCDETAILYNGALSERGKPEDILQPTSIMKHWGYTPYQVNTKRGNFLV